MKGAINARLACAAEYVRQNAILADIGTDHAYLPLFLLDEGRIEYAYCCDINQGPLDSAMRNAEERGRLDKCSFILTDGAATLANLGITDYAICGMGGELIADIIDRAPHLRDGNIRLILQPMSRQEKLRRYLAECGFVISSESYTTDGGKHYVCMLAHYDGKLRQISDIDAITGNCEHLGGGHYIAYLSGKRASVTRALKGKQEAGLDSSDEERLLAHLNQLICKEEMAL